jgi:hypothetical protein
MMKQLLPELADGDATGISSQPVPKRAQEAGSATRVACGAGLGGLNGGAVTAGP